MSDHTQRSGWGVCNPAPLCVHDWQLVRKSADGSHTTDKCSRCKIYRTEYLSPSTITHEQVRGGE